MAASEQSVLQLMCWKQEKRASIRIWGTLTRAKLQWLDDRIKVFPKKIGVFPIHGGQHLPKVSQGQTTVESVTRSRTTKAHWCGREWKLAHLVLFLWRAAIVQIDVKANAGYTRQVLRVPILWPLSTLKCLRWTCECRNWTISCGRLGLF